MIGFGEGVWKPYLNRLRMKWGHGAKSRCKVNPVHMLGNHDMQPDWGDGAVSYPEPLLQSLWQPLNVDNKVSHWVRRPRFVKEDGFWSSKAEDRRISVSWFCCLRLCHLPPILPVDGTDGQFFSSMIHVIFTLSHTIFTNELLDTTLSWYLLVFSSSAKEWWLPCLILGYWFCNTIFYKGKINQSFY